MNTKLKIAFGCHMFTVAMLVLTGLSRLFSTEVMSYHLAAIDKPWGEIEPGTQIVLLALMHLGASAFLASALAIGVLLHYPFRQGLAWSRWAIPAISLAIWIPALLGTWRINVNTGAHAPIGVAAFMIVTSITGLVLSLLAENDLAKPDSGN